MIHDSIRGDPVGGPPSSRPWGPLRTGTRLGGRVAEPVHRTRLDRTPADRPQLEAGRHGIDGAIGARVDVNRAKLDEADWVEEEEEEEEGIEATIYALMELTRWWSVNGDRRLLRATAIKTPGLKQIFNQTRIKPGKNPKWIPLITAGWTSTGPLNRQRRHSNFFNGCWLGSLVRLFFVTFSSHFPNNCFVVKLLLLLFYHQSLKTNRQQQRDKKIVNDI